jgi:hypothetical protein
MTLWVSLVGEIAVSFIDDGGPRGGFLLLPSVDNLDQILHCIQGREALPVSQPTMTSYGSLHKLSATSQMIISTQALICHNCYQHVPHPVDNAVIIVSFPPSQSRVGYMTQHRPRLGACAVFSLLAYIPG